MNPDKAADCAEQATMRLCSGSVSVTEEQDSGLCQLLFWERRFFHQYTTFTTQSEWQRDTSALQANSDPPKHSAERQHKQERSLVPVIPFAIAK